MRGPTSSPWEPSGLSLGPVTQSEIGYHGGKVKVHRPRVRGPSLAMRWAWRAWQVLRDGNLLLEWALNLMVLNVSTRKYHRAVRLPEGDLAKARGDGTSKSAVSRRFVALSTQEDEGLARLGPLGTRPAGHPDRRSACRRPCPGGGDRRRWQRRQACPGRGRGGDGEHGRRPGLDRQSPRQGARSDVCLGCSSSMARRHSAKRSATPSVWPPPSSAARSTRAVTSSSACPNICMRASRRRSVRPGTRTTQTRPRAAVLRNLAPASGA